MKIKLKKHPYQLTTMMIMVVTGIIILAMFVESTGIAVTFKFFSFYFLFMLLFFGVSLWLKQNWICYQPAIFLMIGSIFGIVLLCIFNSRFDDFGSALIIIVAIVGLVLSGISYLAARLFIIYVIENKEAHFVNELKTQIDLIAISVGLISWIRIALMTYRSTYDFSFFLPIILVIIIIVLLGIGVLVLILFALHRIDQKTTFIGLLLFLLYLPISYLINSDIIRILIWIGLSNWLIFGTLFMMGLRKHKKNCPLDIHEEKGDYYD